MYENVIIEHLFCMTDIYIYQSLYIYKEGKGKENGEPFKKQNKSPWSCISLISFLRSML